MALAREAADPVLINDAATDLARRHLISGMYHDALAAMKEIDYPAAARAGQLPEIDYVLLNTYRTLVSFTRDGVLLQEYREKEAQSSTFSTLLACNFLVTAHICFRCWEFWSLGGLEEFYYLLRNS